MVSMPAAFRAVSFSTATEVSEMSGRGVGLAAVRGAVIVLLARA